MKRKMKYIRKMTMAALVAFSVVACNYTKSDEPNNGEGGNQNPVNRTAAEEVTMGGNGGGYYNGHEYVDLGLPSGTLWATCNVGADTPEEYGDYFAWGETQPKDHYNISNYKYSYGDYGNLTKYCKNASHGHNGFTDNLTILQAGDDAASANWGNGWCMPTVEQWRELQDYTNTEWTTQNGVKGRLFTAKNGNSGNRLFLPAAGYHPSGSGLYDAGRYGYYWSSSLFQGLPTNAWGSWHAWSFSVYSGYTEVKHDHRMDGRSVRAVCSPRQN